MMETETRGTLASRGPIERCKSVIEQYRSDKRHDPYPHFVRGDFNLNDVEWLIGIAEAEMTRKARNARSICEHQVLPGERCFICKPYNRWSQHEHIFAGSPLQCKICGRTPTETLK